MTQRVPQSLQYVCTEYLRKVQHSRACWCTACNQKVFGWQAHLAVAAAANTFCQGAQVPLLWQHTDVYGGLRVDREILHFQGYFLCLDWGNLMENRQQLCRATAGTGGVADSAEGYHAGLGGGSSKGCRVSLSGGEAHGGRGRHADAQNCPGAPNFQIHTALDPNFTTRRTPYFTQIELTQSVIPCVLGTSNSRACGAQGCNSVGSAQCEFQCRPSCSSSLPGRRKCGIVRLL